MREFLGLDTSNYTTSCAIFDAESGTVRQAKKLLPVKAGMAGLRQSDAVFHHTRQLPEVIQTLLPNPPQNLTGIGVTTRPRNIEGSYMPCFLCGKTMAYGMAAVTGVPVYETSHQIGHILAALYSAKKLSFLKAPFLALPCERWNNRLFALRTRYRFVLEHYTSWNVIRLESWAGN